MSIYTAVNFTVSTVVCFVECWVTTLHLFNGLFSRTTWVSWHQKGRTILDFTEARHDGVAVALAGPYANHLHLAPTV